MQEASAVHNSPSKAWFSVAVIHSVSSPMQIYPLFSAGLELTCFPPVPRHVFSRISHSFASVSTFAGTECKSESPSEGRLGSRTGQECTTSVYLPQKTKLKKQYFAIT